MPNPQQPELRRSGLGSTTDDSAKSKATSAGGIADDSGVAPVPPANRPGHRPEEEQDKPDLDAFVERASGTDGCTTDPSGAASARRAR